jgi:hypothetical protein
MLAACFKSLSGRRALESVKAGAGCFDGPSDLDLADIQDPICNPKKAATLDSRFASVADAKDDAHEKAAHRNAFCMCVTGETGKNRPWRRSWQHSQDCLV